MHDDASIRAMAKRLRESYENREVHGKPLKFVVRRPAGKVGRAGEFFIHEHLAAIYLYVPTAKPPTQFQVFCTLTHELGHWCSWRDGTRSSEYEAAIKNDPAAMVTLPEFSRLSIFDEEVTAWVHGYRLAQEVGFMDAQAYDAEALRALGFYRESLGVYPATRSVTTVLTVLPSV